MTSSRKRSKPVLRRLLVVAGCLAAFGLAVFAFLHLWAGRVDPQALDKSVAFLKASNPTAARAAALEAIRGNPNSADAHLALARADLALQDGVGAEAEIQRAVDNGYDARLTHQLVAEALVLEGQPDKAVDEVEKTDPADRPYGLRIRARAMTALGNLAAARDSLDEAIRVAPNDARVWTDAGRFRFTAGDMLGAIEASTKAVQLDPGSLEALLLRGQVVRAQYGLVAALPWFEAALKRDPAYHDALIEYAATLGDAGRTVDMLAATRRALAVRPSSPQAYYLQAVLAARDGNYDLARSLAEKTEGTIDALPGMLLLGGTLDLEAGDYQQAIGKLKQLVDAQPMNLTARKLYAVALLRSDAARNAIDVLRPVVTRGDADSYVLTLAARGFERIGDRANAAQLLDRAAFPARDDSAPFSADDTLAALGGEAQERPNDPTAVVPLIRGLIDSGDKGGALARAQAIEAANPGAPGSHVVVGDVLMLLGRYADAATAYKAAADLRFDEPTMLRLVDALDRAGRRGDASNTLALFLSQNPADVAALRLSAHWQLASGDYDAAIDTLEGLHARIGDRDSALDAELAAAYAAANDVENARDYGQSAYELAPGNPAAVDAYGWALFTGGDNAGALELLQKAVALAPGHSGLRWHLAQVYAALNRKPDARAQAQAALADPGFPERAQAQALIAKLS